MSPHNDPLLRELYSEGFADMSNLEAAELALAIQRVVRGENLDDIDPESARLYRQFMARVDAASTQYDRDREAFIENSHNEANRPSEKEAVKLREEAREKFDFYRQQARMSKQEKKQFMINHIKNGPFEEVYVEPKLVVGRIGDTQHASTEGQIIGLNGVRIYLEPGLNSKVPKMYADRYRQIERSRKETQARKDILMGKGIDPTGGPAIKDGWQQLANRMHEIGDEYGSRAGSGESGDRWDTPDLWQQF